MKLPVKGFVRLFVNGEEVCSGSNTVVTSGLELLAKRIMGTEGALLPSLLKFGEDGRTTTEDMTTLQGAVLHTTAAEVSNEGRVLRWSSDFTYNSGTSMTFRELGLFTNEASPVMLCRFLTQGATTIVRDAMLSVRWEITIGE